MKKTRRRIGSFLLALAMICSLFSGTGFVAEAEGKLDIAEVELNLALPLPGESGKVKFSVPDDAPYTISLDSRYGDSWALGNISSNPADVIKNGYGYGALFIVTAKEGYQLTPETTVKVPDGFAGTVNLIGGAEHPASLIEVIYNSKALGSIDHVVLTSAPEAAVGGNPGSYSESGEHYNATGVWEVYNPVSATYEPVAADAAFAEGGYYRLVISVKAETGYVFKSGFDLTINGNPVYDNISNEGEYAFKVYRYALFVDGLISEIFLSEDDIPDPVAGQSFSGSIDIPVAEDSHYTITGHWTDAYGNTEGTFEKGEVYYFDITAYAENGYAFEDVVTVYMDGEPGHGIQTDGVSASDIIRYSLAEMIDKISLSGLPKAVVGEAIPESVEIKVPADAKYTAKGCWIDENGNAAEGKFKDGKAYRLCVSVDANEGFEFTDKVEASVDGVREALYSDSYDSVYFEKYYSFRKVIDKVEVTGAGNPEAGKSADVSGLKVPADADYEIVSAEWRDYDTDEIVSTFEKGHEYVLQVLLEPKEGYEFSKDAELLLDGKKPFNGEIESEDARIFGYVSLKEVVKEIRVDNVPAMKVGEQSRTDIKIPENAKYTAEAVWCVWNEKEGFVEFSGKFEAGKVYRLEVVVFPKDGCIFDSEKTAFYVNGKADDNASVYAHSAYCRKDFSSGLKVISQVVLTVEKPVIGNHSSVDPIWKTAAGANYTVSEGYSDWLVGDENNIEYFEGYFAAGENYGVDFAVIANEGYVFAENLKVVINGVTLKAKCFDAGMKTVTGYYFFNMTSGSGSAGGPGTPPTGDDTAIETFAMMFILCGAGLVYMNVSMKRKKYR